ncbi:MAG: transporter substrate-binding domain-containing protein [Alphaproteobacteria bacterium]|nr:transporter substrate-binding domain-containing protein [Alphaproteobacteria bacterium]
MLDSVARGGYSRYMRSFYIILLAAVVSLAVSLALPLFKADSPAQHDGGTAYDRVMKTGVLRCGYFVLDGYLHKDMESGALGGPAYEIIEALAKIISVKVEWVQEAAFASIGEDLKQGRYDMMCAPLLPNGPRSRVMAMSRPVWWQPLTIWLNKDDARLSDTPEWLNAPETKFSVIDGTGFPTVVSSFYPQAGMVALPEMTAISEMFLELTGRKVDALLMMHYPAVKYAARNDGAIVQYTNRIVSYLPYRFAWAKGDQKMAEMVDIALEELVYTGVINNILDKYDPEGIFYKRPE